MKIMLWINLDDESRQLIQTCIPDDEIYIANKNDADEVNQAAFLASEVAFGNVPPAWLADAEKLCWMQLESVGFGEYLGKVPDHLVITNLHGFSRISVSETIIAGILALYRRLDFLIPAREEQNWQMPLVRSTAKLLAGSRVLLMGAGSIGSQTRLLLQAFKCEVKTFARNESADINTLPELDAELALSDIVIASLPHTSLTDTMLDASRLAKFKQGAIFVNVGRGTLVDESALVTALNSGAIGGAVLDVTRQEPLPAGHPFWQTPNTILMQHSGGGYDRETIDKARLFLDNLEHYRSHQPLRNIVDFERGY